MELDGRPVGTSKFSEKAVAVDLAKHWLFAAGSDSELWSDEAGLQPEAVRAFARKVESGEAEPPALSHEGAEDAAEP